MSRLPACYGADGVNAFRRIGVELEHQTGSHMILRHPSGRGLVGPNQREQVKHTLHIVTSDARLLRVLCK
jgi:predicted RNA binding protein YcfA (HicA-like mRNA interferase family)